MATSTVNRKNSDKDVCDGMVFGAFESKTDAESCYSALLAKGYSHADVNVMMSEKTRGRDYVLPADKGTSAGSKMTDGMGVGGAIGTAVGATIAAIAAVGTSIVFPPAAGILGGLIVAGPLAAGLAGGGAGAVAGGLIGALVGLGMTEQDAQKYNEVLARGGVILSVQTRDSDEAKDVHKIMVDHGGKEVASC